MASIKNTKCFRIKLCIFPAKYMYVFAVILGKKIAITSLQHSYQFVLLEQASFVRYEAQTDKNVYNLATICTWIYVECSTNADIKTIYKSCLSKFALCVFKKVFTKNVNSLRLHCFSQNVYPIKYNFNQQFSNYFSYECRMTIEIFLHNQWRSISVKRTWISKLGKIIVFYELMFWLNLNVYYVPSE